MKKVYLEETNNRIRFGADDLKIINKKVKEVSVKVIMFDYRREFYLRWEDKCVNFF
jgi:hypothetical protein